MYKTGATGPDELITRHAPLVRRIAYHLLGRLPASVSVEDLMQAGMIGLLEAAGSFEAGRGASFETFAGIRIRGAMIDEIRRGDWAPRSVHRNARQVATAIRTVEARSGGDAGDAAIARELGVGLTEYHGLLQDTLGCRLFSLDELLDDTQGERAQPVGADDDPAEQVVRERTAAAVAAAIERLPERERLALSLYYGEELNLKEIGLVLEVSESRVSQILSQATQRLRVRFAGSTT